MKKEILEKIAEITIDLNYSILLALKKMDKVGKKLLIVIQDKKFIGLLSIGDIQRAIIKNLSLETKIEKILRKKIRVAYEHEDFETIKNRMVDYRTECMPVLDSKNNLMDVYFWADVFKRKYEFSGEKLEIPVVIMAGGKGTRLKPITNIIPKPLIPIGEKPIIEVIMDRFNKIGVKKFYISLNYKSETVKFHLKNFKNKNYSITFLNEKKPLGTVGSLSLLKNKIQSTFFLTNCDILIDQDYREIYKFHKENKNCLTAVAALKHHKIPYGTFKTGVNGQLISMMEKPEITYKINSGLYILEPHLLNEMHQNEFFHINDLINKAMRKGLQVGVFPVSEKSWQDIGDWSEYLKNAKLF